MQKEVYLALATALDAFTGDIKALLDNHELAYESYHLQKVAAELSMLNEKSLEVLKSRDTEIEDIGAIVQNILHQPISNGQQKTTTNMLKSAEEFSKSLSPESSLGQVLANYIRYGHATERLVQELELLSDELKEYAA